MTPRLPLCLVLAAAPLTAPVGAWAQVWPIAAPAPVRAAETAPEPAPQPSLAGTPAIRRSLPATDNVASRSVPSKAAPAAPEPVVASAEPPIGPGRMSLAGSLAGARPGETLRLPQTELITGSTPAAAPRQTTR